MLRFYFPNEIKNSTHSDEKISRLKHNKQSLKTYSSKYTDKSFRLYMPNKYYILTCSLKDLKRKQNVLKLETTRLLFSFFIEGNNAYVQQDLNKHLKSKT